eukprot:9910263-Alexandrium_andersonii.AAC.1
MGASGVSRRRQLRGSGGVVAPPGSSEGSRGRQPPGQGQEIAGDVAAHLLPPTCCRPGRRRRRRRGGWT